MNWIWTALFVFTMLLFTAKLDNKTLTSASEPQPPGPCAVLIIDPKPEPPFIGPNDDDRTCSVPIIDP